MEDFQNLHGEEIIEEKVNKPRNVIDFRKMVVEGIDGEPMKNESGIIYFDFSKELGNHIFNNTSDILFSDFGKEIYYNGEVEINKQIVEVFIHHVEISEFKAPFKKAILQKLEEIKNNL